MIRPARHTRIPNLPFIGTLSGARLRAFHEQVAQGPGGKERVFIVDYDAFVPSSPARMFSENDVIYEQVSGSWVPQRLRFTGVHSVQRDGAYASLEALPLDHPARSLRSLLAWVIRGDTGLFSLFAHGSDEPARLWIRSRGCQHEQRDGAPEPADLVRDWSSPPPFRPGLVHEPKKLHQRYGGDPVAVCLGGRLQPSRLFVGGIEYQTEQRPRVDAVLNVGEEQSQWAKGGACHPTDRCVTRGEGSRGMTVAELLEEANWVVERLRQGQRVLVHCVAGLNRSTTVCCAVLILLEGLTTEAALSRVRERHAWARPDDHHWLILKWLAEHPPA